MQHAETSMLHANAVVSNSARYTAAHLQERNNI